MKKLLFTSYFISIVFCSGFVLAQDTIKIMPLGDSITELNWQGGYRSYLYKLLLDSGFTFDYVGRQTKNHDQNSLGFAFPQPYWDHEGYTGRAIFPTWLDHIDTALNANHPDIILLMLGTNDVANGTRSALQIRNYMSALLDSIWKFDPNIKIVLSNLPRVVPGSLFSQKKLDSTINTNALWPGLVAEKKQAGRYIIMIDNFNALTDSTDFDGDGVHPSVAGYKKMRYVWYPAVVAALTGKDFVGIPVLTNPVSGATGISTSPTLSWGLSAGAVSYQLQVSTDALFGTTVVNQNNITATTFPVIGLNINTKYYWRVRASKDSITTLFSSTWNFTTIGPSDTTSPTVSISSPSSGAVVSNTIPISAVAADSVGVIGVQFKIDGVNVGIEDISSPYSINWNTTTFSNGDHSISATARDAAGNTKTSQSVSVTVTNTIDPPSDSIKIMPFGDSITELDWQGGYRSYLYKLLSDSGYKFDYVGRRNMNHNDGSIGFPIPAAYWDHEGYTGRAIFPTWLDDVGAAMKANVPDIALVLLGTNDAANGTRSAVQIRDYMSSLLDSLWKYNPSMKIILSTMPRQVPGSLFNAKTLDTIKNTNALWPALVNTKKLAGRYITLVDNFSALTDSTDFTGDGIHPSPAGYRKMRYVWYPAVVTALKVTSAVKTPLSIIPNSFELNQNFPNPFNPSTQIRYSIPSDSYITLNVYDVLGRLITSLVDGKVSAGTHTVSFNATAIPTGVYVYTMSAGGFSIARKMVLIK